MVAEQSVPTIPGPSLPEEARPLQVWLELPARVSGRWSHSVRVSGSSPLSLLRGRAKDLLGTPHLDAYLCVDGHLISGSYTSPVFRTAQGYSYPIRWFDDVWFRVVLVYWAIEDDIKKITRKNDIGIFFR